MSNKPKKQKEITLKGVIPPKKTTPEAFNEALKDIREFLKQFPYLAEEIKQKREEELSELRALAEAMDQESEFHALVEEIKKKREKELSEMQALAKLMNQKSER